MELDKSIDDMLQKAFLFDTEQEKNIFLSTNNKRGLRYTKNTIEELYIYGNVINQIEMELLKSNQKETLSLVRFMRDTGIRFRDALELTTDNMKGREVLMIERKLGSRYYHNPDGSRPSISETTMQILSAGEDGRYFHHGPEYCIYIIRRISPESDFVFHHLRKYYKLRRQYQTMSRKQ